jgi:hypothetical protein
MAAVSEALSDEPRIEPGPVNTTALLRAYETLKAENELLRLEGAARKEASKVRDAGFEAEERKERIVNSRFKRWMRAAVLFISMGVAGTSLTDEELHPGNSAQDVEQVTAALVAARLAMGGGDGGDRDRKDDQGKRGGS